VRVALYLLGIALVLLHSVGQAAELYGQVVRVSDGDTITITDAELNRYRVRLAGIDAPERRQAYGKVSKKYLASRLIGKSVLVDWHKTDRYGRLVGKVSIDASDVGLGQIKAGMAWHYRQYANEQSSGDQMAYAAAEVGARRARIGLWKGSEPIPPWEFRHKLGSTVTSFLSSPQ